jgi:hypothetical protein
LPFVFAAVVDPDDVLVVQARGQVGFPVEAFAKFEVRRVLAGQDLEGVTAGQPGMLRQIDFTHSPGTQLPHDGVSGESLAFCEAIGLRHVSMLLTRRGSAFHQNCGRC